MPDGPDFYESMTVLYANEKENVNYTKEWYRHRGRYKSSRNYIDKNEVFVMAPHGGSIETGTTELTLAAAGFVSGFNGMLDTDSTYDYFIFNGVNPKDQNGKLHVTSSNYDDETANTLVEKSLISIAFHGCKDKQPNESTGKGYSACLIGGIDQPFKLLLEQKLQIAGFNAFISLQEMLNGDLASNIINKNRRKAGAQFELTTSFRRSLFTLNTRKNRKKTTTPVFWLFINTIRSAIENYRLQVGT